MQDFGLSFAMCVHGSLGKERFKDNRVPRLTFGEAYPEGLGAVRFFRSRKTPVLNLGVV